MGTALIIDDDTFMAGIFVHSLERAGFKVILEPDGIAGLCTAKKKAPDIILLDVLMPEMNGFEVLERLKKDPKTALIPVVMLTSLRQESDIKEGLARGAAAYIVKTKTLPEDTVATVKRVLDTARKKGTA